MAIAILSFAAPGRVGFRCDAAGIEEHRELDANPPFAAWASEYAAAQHHPVHALRLLERERSKDIEQAGRTASEELWLIELGRAIGKWLDGEQRWLARLLKTALDRRKPVPEPLIFEIETSAQLGAIEQAALDAPWELIAADEIGYLALDPGVRLSPVRRLDVAGIARPPSRCRLSVLFMAAQPRDITILDFEREEAAIAARVGELDPDMLDLFVEETGMLDGLTAAAQRAAECTIAGSDAHVGPVDVVHISCHGRGGAKPALVLEDEVGARAEATAADLDSKLRAHVPALAFVSACSTAEASAVGRSLAAELCMRGWPAVLGWSGPVDDGEATWLAARLYRGLAQRMSLAEALAPCRLETVEPGRSPRRVWHQARLFLGRNGGRIEGGSVARRPAPAEHRQYLDRLDRVPIARDDEFVGRRRALQRVLASLRSDQVVGAVIHGAGQLGKSSLAARVSSRRHDLQTVVVYRDYDATAILTAIATEVREGTDEIIARHRPEGAWDAPAFRRALRELLEGPCRAAHAGAILLVIDDFEQVLEPPRAPATHASVRAELAATIGVLIGAFTEARTRSRLLFTSRHRFVAPDAQGADLARHLWHEPLGAMLPDDLAKRVRASERGAAHGDEVLDLCRGNPGLLQVLLAVLHRTPGSWPIVRDELRAYAGRGAPVTHVELAAFMAGAGSDRLIGTLDPAERELLRLLTAFRTHVPDSVAAALGDLVGIDDRGRAARSIERMVTLSLLDLALPAASPAGAVAAARSDEREVAVNALAAPQALAATRPVPEGAAAAVARSALAQLRIAWDAAVRSRALRECHELGRLASLTGDTEVLAEVAGPYVRALARTDAGGAALLSIEVEGSEALWRDADELAVMSEVCRIAGHAEVAARLVRRGLVCEDLTPDARGRLQLALADWHDQRGELDEALRLFHEEILPVYERLADARSKAVMKGRIADILYARGELDEALRIRTEEELPVYERLGDAREQAVTQSKIADVLYARGERGEALRIWREDVLPIHERFGELRRQAHVQMKIANTLHARGAPDEALQTLREQAMPLCERVGDVQARATALGMIAAILTGRGELDEALRIRTQEELPAYVQVGDVRSKAVAQGRIADLRAARGELDEALRIWKEEVLPVHERVGDVRSKAAAQGRIADLRAARGELDEALRIWKEEVLPVHERVGDAQGLCSGLASYAAMLVQEPTLARAAEARDCLRRSIAIADQIGLVLSDELRGLLAQLEQLFDA